MLILWAIRRDRGWLHWRCLRRRVAEEGDRGQLVSLLVVFLVIDLLASTYFRHTGYPLPSPCGDSVERWLPSTRGRGSSIRVIGTNC